MVPNCLEGLKNSFLSDSYYTWAQNGKSEPNMPCAGGFANQFLVDKENEDD